MSNLYKKILTASAFAFLLTFSAKSYFTNGKYTAATPKIALANYESLIKLLPDCKKAEEEIKKYVEEQKIIFNKKVEDLRIEQENFQKNENTLSPEEKKIKQENLSRKMQELQESEVTFQKDLRSKDEEWMNFLKNKIEKYVDEFAKHNGIDILLDSSMCEKIYNKNFDITEEISAKIKAEIAKPNSRVISSTAKK